MNHCLPDYGPEILILDSTSIVRNFRDTIGRLPMVSEIQEDLMMDFLFDYISDRDYAGGSILEFGDEMQAMYSHRYDPISVSMFGSALKELGKALYDLLLSLNAYDQNGTFWYSFNGFNNNDIILRKITEIDIN